MFSPNTYLYFSIFCFSLILILRLFSGMPSSKIVADLKIPKRKFVLLVLEWCSTNLGSLKYGYELDVKYHKNKVYGGIYILHTRTIRIYMFDDLPLIDLTEIIIHEYIHYLQNCKKGVDVEYKKYQREVGYWNNPFEIEARRLSKIHKNQCYEDIVNSKRVV